MQMITVKELSEVLKVKEKTIYQWAGMKTIPCVKMNGTLRFDTDEIEKWIEDCKKDAGVSYNMLSKLEAHQKGGKR